MLPGGRVAVPGGLGLVGVIIFVAVQLLGGGSARSVPTAFDDGATAPDARGFPPIRTLSAIAASEAVGDDRLQRAARGTVDPDSFTHGTSASARLVPGRARERRARGLRTFSAVEV